MKTADQKSLIMLIRLVQAAATPVLILATITASALVVRDKLIEPVKAVHHSTEQRERYWEREAAVYLTRSIDCTRPLVKRLEP